MRDVSAGGRTVTAIATRVTRTIIARRRVSSREFSSIRDPRASNRTNVETSSSRGVLFYLYGIHSDKARFSSALVFSAVERLSSRDFPLFPEKFGARVVPTESRTTSGRTSWRMTLDFRNDSRTYHGNQKATREATRRFRAKVQIIPWAHANHFFLETRMDHDGERGSSVFERERAAKRNTTFPGSFYSETT